MAMPPSDVQSPDDCLTFACSRRSSGLAGLRAVPQDGAELRMAKRSRGFLSSDYLPKIERCLAVLRDEDVWWRANEGSNSIGNLVLHLIITLTKMRSGDRRLPDS